jgi:hypothetical protein
MPLVSITRLRVRSFRYLPAFAVQAFRSARQAKNAPGNLAVSLLKDSHFTFWTRTLWSDEAAMRAFMIVGAHRHVMPHLLQWCDEAAVVHWVQDTVEPPVVAGGLPPAATGGPRIAGESSVRGATCVPDPALEHQPAVDAQVARLVGRTIRGSSATGWPIRP